jgi:hypothetical protein
MWHVAEVARAIMVTPAGITPLRWEGLGSGHISPACSQEVECGLARGRRSKQDNLAENRPEDEQEQNKYILYRTHLARI